MSNLSITRCGAILLALASVAVLQSCSDDDDDGVQPVQTITVALSPTSASVAQGGSTQVGVTVTGTNGFAGTPTITVTNPPTGVTGTVSNAQTTGSTTTATLTLAVAAATAPGAYNITVTGAGTGVSNATATFALTVTAPTGGGDYSLSATPATVTVTQGGAAGTSTINIARTGGFAASVGLAVTGAPTGMTATLNPTSTTGGTSTLSVTAGATTPTGNHNLTITGTAAGTANKTTIVTVTVNASGGSGNVTVDFSGCATSQKPIWLAFQNGTTGWTQSTPTNDVYRFSITQSKGGIAYTLPGTGGATSVVVQYLTQAEVTAGTLKFCPAGGGNTVNGTVAGLTTLGDAANVSLGGGTASAFANGAFSITNVLSGTHDFIGYRFNAVTPGASDRLIIRRDQNIANNGSLGTVDFGAAEAIAPATATGTVAGAGSDQVFASMTYYVETLCLASSLGSNLVSGTTFTMRGVPAAQQRTTDSHVITIGAVAGQSPSSPVRTLLESFKTLANRTFTLGPALPNPTVTALTGPYKRLQSSVTLPAEYQSAMTLYYGAQGANTSASVIATFGWLGSANAVLAFPDFTGVTGWQNSWAPASNATVTWTTSGTGSNLTSASFCVDGARVRSASVLGTI